MKNLVHYVNCEKPELRTLVDGDISYTVLYNILGYECDHTITDGENLIICHSNPPYPVWIWRKNGDNLNCAMTIAQCIKENFPLDKYSITVPMDTLEKLKLIDEYFNDAKVKTELFSYKLTRMQDFGRSCDGNAELAMMDDLDELAMIWQRMALEMEGFEFDIEHCRESVAGLIEDARLFVWKNNEGKIVATTNYGVIERYGKVAGVYTLPEHRRCGYAINLVSKVTRIILDAGLVPTLYTDGKYLASNECYKKIGYVQVGKLVTIHK